MAAGWERQPPPCFWWGYSVQPGLVLNDGIGSEPQEHCLYFAYYLLLICIYSLLTIHSYGTGIVFNISSITCVMPMSSASAS